MAGASAATAPVLQTLTYTATGPGGGLYQPVGVSAANGTVYVSDTGANVLAAIASGATTAFAGSLSAFGEHGDGGPATSASLYHPGGTADDAKGDVFIADSGDNVVREVTPAGIIRRIAGTGIAGLGFAGPSASPPPSASSTTPRTSPSTPPGDVFIADTYNNRVVKVTPQGQVVAVAGDGVAGYSGDGRLAAFAELNSARPAWPWTRKGNLYIADSANNVIRRVDAKTGIITTVAGDFAADKANDGLGGFTGDGGPATSAQLNDPQGVAVDGAGDLFIADTFNNAIREVTPAGTITTVVNAAPAAAAPRRRRREQRQAPTASKLNTPYGVAIDPSTDTSTSPTPTTARSPQVTGLAQPGDAPARPPLLSPDAPATRRRRDIMTDKHTHSFGPRIEPPPFLGQRGRRRRRGRAGRRPAREPRPGGDQRAPARFDLSQVKHLVFLMQENRRFDHYFGTFPGARGFSDPTAIRLPTGRSVFQQPDPANPDGFLEPYHMSTITTGAAAVPSCRTTGATSTPPGTRARWTAGCSPTSPPTATTNGSFTMGYYDAGGHPLPLGARQGVHPGGQLPLLGHGPDRPQPADLVDGHQRPAGDGRRPDPGDQRCARPDLRKRRARRCSTPGSASSATRQRLDRPDTTAATSSSSGPRGWCPTPCSTP